MEREGRSSEGPIIAENGVQLNRDVEILLRANEDPESVRRGTRESSRDSAKNDASSLKPSEEPSVLANAA